MRKRVILPGALRQIRKLKEQGDDRFTVSQFALKCDMTPGHLCNIEAGRKQPPENVIHRIAAHLDVDVEAISYFDCTADHQEAVA